MDGIAQMIPVSISIVVPHYNDLTALDCCLTRLTAQDVPRERFEIIVSDNMSPLGAEAVVAVIAGRARLVIATERGAGPARNAGVQTATGEILAFTDCDCSPEPGWLGAGIAALDRFDLVGGAMTVSIDHDGALSGAEAFEKVFAFDNQRYVEEKGFTVTANLFCRRAVLDAVGQFKVGVSEDFDWCQRAKDLGYRIGYAADAIIAHPARRDWPALLSKWRRLNAESFALMTEQPRGRAKWAIRSMGLLPSILVHMPRVLTSKALRTGAERRRALATLARLRWWRFVDAQRLLFRGR